MSFENTLLSHQRDLKRIPHWRMMRKKKHKNVEYFLAQRLAEIMPKNYPHTSFNHEVSPKKVKGDPI